MIDHNERDAAEVAWEEGFEAGTDHARNDHTPGGQSIDPPLNPYANGEPKTVKPEADRAEVQVWYSSLTPDGALWCETRDLEELRRQKHPAHQLAYYRHAVRIDRHYLPVEKIDPASEVQP